MFALRTDGQSALFTEDNEDVHDCEQSSDGGSASNSDAEPEEQDSESDEDDPSVSTHPGNQMIAGRHWKYIASDNSSVEYLQRKCSLTERSEHVATVDECFHLFINEEIIHTVILYTIMKTNKCTPPNKNWKPVDRTEMDAFFGLLLLIGRFRESRERKQDLWKTTDALSWQFYIATMSRDRFIDILRLILQRRLSKRCRLVPCREDRTPSASPNLMAFDLRKGWNTIKKSEMSRISAFLIRSLRK